MSDGDDARRDAHEGHTPREGDAPAEPVGSNGLTGPNEQEQSKHTHAGNGTVNHGPAEQGPDTQGSDTQAPDGTDDTDVPDATDGSERPDGPDGLDPDELALRRMMHHVVREVAPSEGTLDHLRREVPARRARKRQAVVGMAAAALFIGTAVPALVHVSNSVGEGANPSVAGNASQAQGGASESKDPAGGQSGDTGSAGTAEGRDEAGPTKTPGDRERDTETGSAPGAGPTASSPAGIPACASGALGPAVASSADPDSTGVVYGSFRVTNVSSDGCVVTGPGSVVTTSLGAAEATRIGTARHASGDAAAGLPDPSLEAASLALAPGSAYEVRFAWVPSETCPVTGGGTPGGGTGGPSPGPSPSEDTTAAGGTTAGGGESGTAPQLLTGDGPADGSVSVTYTPEGGSGAATASVSNACAGTVYWTGVLAGTDT